MLGKKVYDDERRPVRGIPAKFQVLINTQYT